MQRIAKILNLLKEQRGFDFSGYRSSMIERRIQKRLDCTGNKNLVDYLDYLKQNTIELDNLIGVLTINVSNFFRNPLTFEFLDKSIIPELLQTKLKANNPNLRIWSAGCSFGEEPYSIAILLNEICEKEKSLIVPTIFATDIDKKALQRALKASYEINSFKELKLGFLEKYFTKSGKKYMLDTKIKKTVQFSFFDMLDKKRLVPPESIYGSFDIVFCRNVLIYFAPEYQEIIFNKLYKSLNQNAYLILGEAEVPVGEFKSKFVRVNKCCKIYRKSA